MGGYGPPGNALTPVAKIMGVVVVGVWRDKSEDPGAAGQAHRLTLVRTANL
jgi:hypothetical protein